MTRPIIFTICAANYLAYARTLFDSVARHMPDADRVLILSDEIAGRFDPGVFDFEVIEAAELNLPQFHDMAMRYTVMELSTAVKPAAFLHLLARHGGPVLYLDPDIQLFAPLTPVVAELDGGADAVFTPHTTAPLEDGLDPDDLRILRTGTFNLGFAALSGSPSARAFLNWWNRQLAGHCRVDLEAGLFVDQRFCDLAPSFLNDCRVLRHAGCNVAYWNLAHRPLSRGADGIWTAGQDPLVFFHFSGVVPGDRTVFSRHQTRFEPGDLGAGRILLEDYLEALERNDVLPDGGRACALDYAFGRLEDGTPIHPLMRTVYARLQPPSARPRAAVFAMDTALWTAAAPQVPPDAGIAISRIMYALWRARDDLRAAFPLDDAASRHGYAAWFAESAARETGLDPRFIPPPPGPLQTAPARVDVRVDMPEAEAPVPLRRQIARLRRRALQTFSPQRPVHHPDASGETAMPSAHPLGRDWPAPGLAPGVGLVGYLRAESGVGHGARLAAQALSAAGVPFTAHALDAARYPNALDPGVTLATGPSPHQALLLHVNADQTAGLRALPGDAALSGRYRIGYWAWELPRLPEAWGDARAVVHEVWTPSRFTADAVSAFAPELPVHVVPHPVHVLPGDGPAAATRWAIPAGRFVFLAVLDLNSFIDRKNPMAVIEAFRLAFPGDAPAGPVLVMKLQGMRPARADHRAVMAAIEDDPRMLAVDAALPPDEVADLMEAAGCVISLHRSEGFGLALADGMARGKPVIATGWSGNLEFMDASNSVLVPGRAVPVPAGAYPHGEGQTWAEPDLRAAAAAMRRVAADPGLAQRIGRAAAEHMAARFSLAAIGARMRARLGQVMPDLGS